LIFWKLLSIHLVFTQFFFIIWTWHCWFFDLIVDYATFLDYICWTLKHSRIVKESLIQNLLRVFYVCLEKQSISINHFSTLGSSSVSTLDFRLSDRKHDRFAKKDTSKHQDSTLQDMSIKKCQPIPIMTLICSMDEYVEFIGMPSARVFRLGLSVLNACRIVTERIHIPLKNSVGTFQRLSRTVLV